MVICIKTLFYYLFYLHHGKAHRQTAMQILVQAQISTWLIVYAKNPSHGICLRKGSYS